MSFIGEKACWKDKKSRVMLEYQGMKSVGDRRMNGSISSTEEEKVYLESDPDPGGGP
jgi:hypothetical protein